MFILNVHIHVLPEHLEAFKQATIINASNSVKEPGVVRFDFIQCRGRPDPFRARRRSTATAPPSPPTRRRRITRRMGGKGRRRWLAEPRTRVFYENIFPDDQGW